MRKTKMILLILSLALTLLLGGNFALAQPSPGGVTSSGELSSPGGVDKPSKQEKNPWFDQIDVNHDMKISQKELIEHRKKNTQEQFKTCDTNNDGFLSLEEWQAHVKERKGVMMTDVIEE